MATIVTLARRRLPTLSTRIPLNASLVSSPYARSYTTRISPNAPPVSSPYARSYTTMPVGSKLVASGMPYRFYNPGTNFEKIHSTPGLPYFDKTGFIPPISRDGIVLLCRPTGFGKSFTVQMLEFFHGVQYIRRYDKLFKGLDVDRAVQDQQIQAGQYLIMKFDFSRINRTPEVEMATKFLRNYINRSLRAFIKVYAPYMGDPLASVLSKFSDDDPVGNLVDLTGAVNLGLRKIKEGSNSDHPLFNVEGIYLLADEYDAFANEYLNPRNVESWTGSMISSLLKGFWSAVKSGTQLTYGIGKVFITGVTPLVLNQTTSGFNIHRNISFKPDYSTVCGLTGSDVLGALRLVCKDEEKVQQCFEELAYHTNGYHFCGRRTVPTVFNTQTVLCYLDEVLQSKVLQGEEPMIADPPNTEVSEMFLKICAGTPIAVQNIQLALQKDEDGNYKKIQYDKVHDNFRLEELSVQATGKGGVAAWQSLLVYMGGLTFDSQDPSEFLKITNRVAGLRFGSALLDRLGLYVSMSQAVRFLSLTGNLNQVLSGYLHLIKQRDVVPSAFKMTEQGHRDSLWVSILENPAIMPRSEYRVSKSSQQVGFVDLVIESKEFYILVEFKNIGISYLDLRGSTIRDNAEQLTAMSLKDILQLQFHKRDKYRSGSIEKWIDGEVRTQLQSYVMGQTVQEKSVGKKFRAYAVVIIGARKILIREMDRKGNWIRNWELIHEMYRTDEEYEEQQEIVE